MPSKDLSDTFGSGKEGSSTSDFPPPSEAQWEAINSGSMASESDDAGPGDDDDEGAPEGDPAAPVTPTEPEPEAEDPDIALPDGTTMKMSELAALRAGKAPAATAKPAAAPAPTLAQQRADFERERQEFKTLQDTHRAAIEELVKNPDKYRELQREAGVNLEPHPVNDQQKWIEFRRQQYINVGWKPEEIPKEKLLADLMQAQTVRTGRELAELRSGLDQQRREVDDRKMFDSVTKELEGLYARPEFAHAATPEGRDMVDALLAQADRDGKDTDLADIVRKANEFGVRLIEKYVGAKSKDIKDTSKILRGGGSHRAPEPKDYGSGYDGFGKIARDRMRTGG